MTLPAAGYFSNVARTQGELKQALEDQRDVIARGISMPVLVKTGAYTVVAGDTGKLIDATSGTWSLTLPAAATAGDGFLFSVKAGSGTITIDPNGAELIDGAATLALAPGDAAIVVCTGSAWRTVARYVAVSALETGTWASVFGSRAIDTVYQNTSGRKRRVAVDLQWSMNGNNNGDIQVGSGNPPTLTTGFVGVSGAVAAVTAFGQVVTEVPNNWYYRVRTIAGTITISEWVELDE